MALSPYVNNDRNWHNDPYCDPYTFLRADDFFTQHLDAGALGSFKNPGTVALQQGPKPKDNKCLTQTGALFRFDPTSSDTPAKYLLIQFIRPQMWRLRFNPQAEKAEDYNNENS